MKKGSKLQTYTVLKIRAIELSTEEGMKPLQIAKVLGVGITTVRTWLKRFEQEGDSYLLPATIGKGKKPFLDSEQVANLSNILVTKTAEDYGFEGDFWTRKRIGQVIEQEFNVTYKERSVGDLLKRMGFSRQTPQKKAIIKKKKK